MDQTQVLQLRNVFSASYINLHIIRTACLHGTKQTIIIIIMPRIELTNKHINKNTWFFTDKI